MPHFNITIAKNIQADVYKGKVFKKNINLLNWLRRKKTTAEERIGYVAVLSFNGNGRKEYYLSKASDGSWANPGDGQFMSIKINGKWCAVADDATTLLLKESIDGYENNKANTL